MLHINNIIYSFAAITHLLCLVAKPLFIEDKNSAYGYKSKHNCCAKWHTTHSIILMPHPSTSPDISPIEKVLEEDQAGITQMLALAYYRS